MSKWTLSFFLQWSASAIQIIHSVIKNQFSFHPLGRWRKSLQHPVHRRWKWVQSRRWPPSDPTPSSYRDRQSRRILEVAAVDREIGVNLEIACYCRLVNVVNKFLRWKEKFSSLLLAARRCANKTQQQRAFDSGIDIENRLQIVIVQMALNGKQKFIRRSGLLML